MNDNIDFNFKINQKAIQDRSLSFEARGMLVYFASLPAEYEVTIEDLKQQCGRDKARRILRELIDADYLIDRKPIRDENTQQIIGYTRYELNISKTLE